MGISLVEFEKALLSLEQVLGLHDASAVHSPEQLAFRDAAIQRFEYCIELAWKSAVKTLGLNTPSPKPAVRELARNNLIEDPVVWIDFIDARNRTSHIYDEAVATEVFAEIKKFMPEARKLLQKLKATPS
jgi:nucleotidyltransferase substrate binding protein (TIGR01987 family)